MSGTHTLINTVRERETGTSAFVRVFTWNAYYTDSMQAVADERHKKV